jgi:putative MATE family efflux protein
LNIHGQIFINFGAFFAASRKKPGFAGLRPRRPAPWLLRTPPIPCAAKPRALGVLFSTCPLTGSYDTMAERNAVMKNVDFSMTEGEPRRLIFRFALPLMIGDIIQQIYTIADSIAVGRLIGVHAFASVSAAGSMYWFVLVIIFGFSHGFGTLTAQAFGSKDAVQLRNSCALSLYLTFVAGLFLTVVCLVLVKPVLAMMRTPVEILDDAVRYSVVLFCGLLCTFFNNTLFSIFRALGDSKTPLYVFAVCSALNIVFDILLILYTPLGVAAAALATVLVQAGSAVFCFWYLTKHTKIRLRRKDFALNRPVIKKLLLLGIPLGLRDCVSAVGGIIIQSVINGYGTIFIAGVAAAKRLYSILFIVGGGIEGAVATFTAQNYGARYFDRVKKGMSVARHIMFAGLVVMIPAMFFFGKNLLGLFISGNTDQINEVLNVAVNQLRVCLIPLPALYILFLYRAGLQGLGNSFIPMLSGFMEALLRILGVLILPVFWGPWGIYIAEPIAWPFMALQLYAGYRGHFKKLADRPLTIA